MPNFGFLDKDVAKTCTSPGYCTVFSLFWGNFDLVIKAKRLFLCMALINVKDVGPLLLKKKNMHCMHTGVETILILILRGWVWEGEFPSCTLRKYLHNPAQNAIIVIPI